MKPTVAAQPEALPELEPLTRTVTERRPLENVAPRAQKGGSHGRSCGAAYFGACGAHVMCGARPSRRASPCLWRSRSSARCRSSALSLPRSSRRDPHIPSVRRPRRPEPSRPPSSSPATRTPIVA
eukprot:1615951-Prymnesium_polylepis.2